MNRNPRILMIVILGVLILQSFLIAPPISNSSKIATPDNSDVIKPLGKSAPSSMSGRGNDIESIMTFSRSIQNQEIDIMNSYANTSIHEGQIDLSGYQVSGWSLYEVEIDAVSIGAIAEREVVGTSSAPIASNAFQIYEHETGLYYDQLAQGFYNREHDGKLENLSILYRTPSYDPGYSNYAYLDIRSDYQDGATNMVSSVPLSYVGYTNTWASVTENAILNANTAYYAVMNGTKLNQIPGNYPSIQWLYQDQYGTFLTLRHNTDGDSWGSNRPYEALLNYSYIPWNKTSNSALEYNNAQTIAMSANSSTLNGMHWLVSSSYNVTDIILSTNQSVSIDYNLELRYKRLVVSTTSWYGDNSGSDVSWNITSVLNYPEVSGTIDKNLTLSIPSDWTAIHLFKESTPTVYDDTFQQNGIIISCNQLSNATWILGCNSPNYITSMQKFDSSNDNPVNDEVIVSVTLDINSTIESAAMAPANNGDSNLRVYHESTMEYSDSSPVSNGKSHHQWDISLYSSTNGLHLIELYWINGTEAGYCKDEVVVYYPTALSADSISINGYTDSNIGINVYYEDTFTPQGLNGSAASVLYSFAGENNISLIDQHNGTWTATISTSGRNPDTYDIQVFAEGYAIENRSLTITTTLIHDTKPLSIHWLNSNNISYIQTTQLQVEYSRVGNTPIPDAKVNVTIDGRVIPLKWDSDLSIYKLTFNGTDTYSGFKTYDLKIEAWKAGYKAQTDTTQQLTIHHEFTKFAIDWSHGTDITYIDYTILTVSYQMDNSTAIPLADVSVSDGTTNWPLEWNGTDGTYWIKFNGSDSNPGYGSHPLIIQASKIGYESKENTSCTLTIDRVSTILDISWSNGNSITYVNSTTLAVNYSMSRGGPVIGATVNVTIGTDFFPIDYNPLTGTYDLILNGSDLDPGFGNHTVIVLAGKIGYYGKVNDTMYFTIDLEPTDMLIHWSSGSNISYVQQTILNVTYLMSNGTPIVGAWVNVTINGHLWNLTWDGSKSYLLLINGSDSPPGFGSYNLTILAGKYGFVNRPNTSEYLTLREENTSIDTEWVGDLSVITYVGSTILWVNYTMSSGAPIERAIIYATTGGNTWNLTWDGTTKTYRWVFYGTDNPPDLGIHTLSINATRFGFITAYDSTTLTINSEPTSLIVDLLPTDKVTYTNHCILSVKYLMNSNNSAITDALVYATIAGVQKQMNWNNTAQAFYLYIEGMVDLQYLGNYSVLVEASRYGFSSGVNSSRSIMFSAEQTSLIVRWANDINNPDFDNYTYLIVEYTYDGSIPIVAARVNVTVESQTLELNWNIDEQYYQLKFNGSDPFPGVGTHSLTIEAWKYGFTGQMNNSLEIIIPVIPTKLSVSWTNGDIITYVQSTSLQVFYTMKNDSLIYDAVVNVTINGVNLTCIWNNNTHAYQITFQGTDASLDFTTYPILVLASKSDFESQSNSDESLTKELEPTSLSASWIGGNNITYYSQTKLLVKFNMSDGIPISTGILNATINGALLNLDWNETSSAYEVLIYGDDNRFDFKSYNVTISASSFGFISVVDTSQTFTIRREDTYLLLQWVPDNIITYLEVTTLRIYYNYTTNHTAVLNAEVNATCFINATYSEFWAATFNINTGAYEISFTGSESLNPFNGPYILEVYASKSNHLSFYDDSQELHVDQEDTAIQAYWLNGNNTITYVENTTIFISYYLSRTDEPIVGANVTVRIGTQIWQTYYDGDSKQYWFTFTGDMDPPGLGNFTLYISAKYAHHQGFKDAFNSMMTLAIESESVKIHSYWIGNDTITYVGFTTLVVNYTMSNGSAIPDAFVNVTIGSGYWILGWDSSSQTYRITFYGSDAPPGLGSYEVDIHASRSGFDSLSDKTLNLEIMEEPSTITSRWSEPHQNNITYFEHTYLFVDYLTSNRTSIQGASVNVTIGLKTWALEWNYTEGSYGIRFNGSDMPPGFGNHSLDIVAVKFGFTFAENATATLTIDKDPTLMVIQWSNGNDISYVENTTLLVYYKMSNGSLISTGTVEATIGAKTWSLKWNTTFQAYIYTFNGTMNPPGIASFKMDIVASGNIFASQMTTVSFEIHEEPTTATPSWTSASIDWTNSSLLLVEYRDSYGRLIADATQKSITVDGIPYTLHGTNGVYSFEFNNTFDLGHHNISFYISRYGYETAFNSSLGIDIVEAPTNLDLHWNSKTIDYLGQIQLLANYSYSGTGGIVPQGGVEANITIDGSIVLPLTISGDYWAVNLDGSYLDLGQHAVVVRAQVYGYAFAEKIDILTVNEVATDALSVNWNPANTTIEYTETIDLIVDYTFYGGDVPTNALVNVTLNGQIYDLTYSSGTWRVTISGEEIGLGVYDAYISAWLHGYALQTNITTGLNVTPAANWFHPIWQPSNQIASYIDTINLSVIYQQDFRPIENATILLFVNGSSYELLYYPIDEMWHFSIKASILGLGTWNVTLTANKTGYVDGWYSNYLVVENANSTLTANISQVTIYYDESSVLDIYYLMSNSSYIPSSELVLLLDGIQQTASWNANHWTLTFNGADLGIGEHNITIFVSALGFDEHTQNLTVTNLLIPTNLVYNDAIVVHALDIFTLRFTYLDNRTSIGIENATIGLDWFSAYSIQDCGNGTYIIELGRSPLHTGNATFGIGLECAGYVNVSGTVEIVVLQVTTDLQTASNISQYENETIIVNVRYLDQIRSIPVTSATIIATLEGTNYTLIYDSQNGNYTASIKLPKNMNPGSYSISITAQAVDYAQGNAEITLDILTKSTYTLSLNLVEQVKSGEDLIITIIVNENAEPVVSVPLTILVTVSTKTGSTIHSRNSITNENGVAVVTFEVPSDATSLEIIAKYSGSISTWPVESSTHHVEVVSGDSGLFYTILKNPLMLSIMASGILVPLFGLIIMRRRRRALSGVIELSSLQSSDASILTPTEMGPLNHVIAEILASDTGLTRAELSTRLSLSSVKIGALVKDLLKSDPRFYEAREGVKRIIRKRE